MLVGVIAFDLSVNVIDRWRMNKIQQRALEAAKIEQKLQEARLELALHQIKPAFFAKCLMSIKVLCRTRPKEAEQAVLRFAVFLRGNMNALESAEMIPFREECKTIERYLHIEKNSFLGERLQVQWDLQEEKFRITASDDPTAGRKRGMSRNLPEDGGRHRTDPKFSEKRRNLCSDPG